MKSKDDNKFKKNKIQRKNVLNKEKTNIFEEKNIINYNKNEYESGLILKGNQLKLQNNERKINNFLKRKRSLKSNDILYDKIKFESINLNKENKRISNKKDFENKVESLSSESIKFCSYLNIINSEEDIINLKIKNNQIIDNYKENKETIDDSHSVDYQKIFEQEFINNYIKGKE